MNLFVQRKLGVSRTSLGSLSKSSRVFDPALLKEIVEDLAGRAAAVDAPQRPAGLADELDVIAVDGSLIEAIPRMAWALWLDDEHRAAKLHLEFDILRGVPKKRHAHRRKRQRKAGLARATRTRPALCA